MKYKSPGAMVRLLRSLQATEQTAHPPGAKQTPSTMSSYFVFLAAVMALASAQLRTLEMNKIPTMMHMHHDPQRNMLDAMPHAKPRAMLQHAMPYAMLQHAMPQAMSREAAAEIVEQDFHMDEPGKYLYKFRTNNGIAMMEQAVHNKDVAKVQGAYEWTSPEGSNYKVEYVADELGYHPVGDHLPGIPEAIARSLEWNAAHPEEDKEASMYAAKKIMY